MSIAPPSDIVLDVAQAADPARLEAAKAHLARLASGATAGSTDFTAALTSVRRASGLPTLTPPAPAVPDDRPTHAATRPGSPYQKFEAVVLQSFVETMLPKDTELFGDETSAGPMRSLLADQIADKLAASGKIGIARAIERAHAPPPGHAALTSAAPLLMPRTFRSTAL